MVGAAPEHVDVLIVGAGLSGVGIAHSLQERLPGRSYAILESREALGGTWDVFRYPGVRSDSDLYTYGYAFRPWTGRSAIAPGSMVLDYVRETAQEEGIEQRVRYSHRVLGADWSSAEARWTVHVERVDTGERVDLTCSWLFFATGYFRYDGFTPELPGIERFGGPVIHPQAWPDDLAHAGKRVVVIGSGATAVTIVPAMAPTAASVTMLQRTPSYFFPIASVDAPGRLLGRLIGDARAYPVVRAKNIAVQRALWVFCQRFPKLARRVLLGIARRSLPPGYPVEEHFGPPYGPWDQRLCFIPDGDFFAAIRGGRAAVVTDRIRTFTETGIELESGKVLDADIVVTATGLVMQALAGADLRVDGEPVVLSDRLAYRGLMLDGVPNLAYAIGYTNTSWTLKIGLVGEYFTRLLAGMDERRLAVCVPRRPARAVAERPLIDLAAGYVRRAADVLPRQGDESPWLTSTGYLDDVRLLRRGPLVDRHLRFRPAPTGARPLP